MPFQEKDELIDFVLTCFHTYHYYDILDCTKDNYKTDGILAGVRFMCLDILSKTDEMIDLVDTMNEAIKNNEPIEDLDFYLDIQIKIKVFDWLVIFDRFIHSINQVDHLIRFT